MNKEEIAKLEAEITAYVDSCDLADLSLMGSMYWKHPSVRRMFHNYHLAEALYEAGWRKETTPKEPTITTTEARETLKSLGEYIKGEFKDAFEYPVPEVIADRIDTIINGLVKEKNENNLPNG